MKVLSKGISQALQDKIPTGRVAALFESNDGLLRRLMGKGIMTAVALKAGPLAASAASEFINQSTSGAKSAASVLASPKFQNIIRTAVREGVTEGNQASAKLIAAEKAFQNSAVFKKWADKLSQSESAKLAGVGVVNFLLQDEESAPATITPQRPPVADIPVNNNP